MICLNNNLKFTIRGGMPYTDHHLALDGDKLQESQGYFSSKYSTEEELTADISEVTGERDKKIVTSSLIIKDIGF